MLCSVIIPVLNEAERIEHALSQLFDALPNQAGVEVIVVDGGSVDNSVQRCRNFPCAVIEAPAGRASQMNAGARLANGDWLLFLHADTELPAEWLAILAHCESVWGRFNVRLESRAPWYRMIETFMNLRSCITGIATGDQAIFVRSAVFSSLGGYQNIPLMEDIALSKDLRPIQFPECVQVPVKVSPRRWQKHGVIRTTLLMWWLRYRYWRGADPALLHRLYYGDQTSKRQA